MEISGINSVAARDFNSLKELMKGKEASEGAEGVLTQSVIAHVATSTSGQHSGGVMSRNVVSAPQSEETSYARKALAGKQAASAQASRQNAVLNSAMSQMDSVDSYAARTLAGQRAARGMMREMQRTVLEESERNLKENRDSVESASNETVTQDTHSTAPAAAAAAADVSTSESAPASSTRTIDVTV